MRKNKIMLMAISTFLVIGTCIGCSNSGKLATLQETTVLTEVGDLGQVTKSIAFKYDQVVANKNLSTNLLEVTYGKPIMDNKGQVTETKTTPVKVNKIYAADAVDGTKSDKGNYVIIEIESFPYANDFKVTQKKDVNNTSNASNEVKLTKADIKNVKTSIVDEFTKETYKDPSSDGKLQYRLFVPKTEENKKYPLILALHGGGEGGDDNTKQVVANKLAVVWANPTNQVKNTSYVIAPQLPKELKVQADKGVLGWNDPNMKKYILATIDELTKKHSNIDTSRIYITGLSMGAMGTWGLIEDNPELFAAAIAICGQGDVSRVTAIKDMPIWAFHAENDPIVPVTGSKAQYSYNSSVKGTRDIVAALRAVGSNVKYTEYKADAAEMKGLPIAHFSWVPTYNNKEVINWLFQQKK